MDYNMSCNTFRPDIRKQRLVFVHTEQTIYVRLKGSLTTMNGTKVQFRPLEQLGCGWIPLHLREKV